MIGSLDRVIKSQPQRTTMSWIEESCGSLWDVTSVQSHQVRKHE